MGWLVFSRMVCRICANEHVAICPDDSPAEVIENSECPKCGRMSCEPECEPEWGE